MDNVAVVVNLRARGSSEAVGQMIRASLPRAKVALTRSFDDVRRFIERVLAPDPPALLLSGGGDGTAVALLNELRKSRVEVPRLGVLRLGTGNAWANVTGAPRPRAAVERIAALGSRTPPTRRFSLIEVDGMIAPFAGTGWDAEIIADFKAQSTGFRSDGLFGYLKGMFTRTIPRHVFGDGPAHVTLTNLGEDALTVDAEGRTVPVPGGGKGAVLYRGPASVAGTATTEEYGFGFRAFPFACRVPGRLSARIYGAGALEATRHMFDLWRGEHPIPKMHDFLLTHGRMDFDREVPFEIGGDLAPARRSFEFRLAGEGVEMVDWSRLRR